MTNAFALLGLLPMSDRAKDVEILALRHQIVVLERHLHGAKVRFTPADRALLAALLNQLPRGMLHQIRLLVRPDTVLRWHRDLIAARHARISRPKRFGRPPTVRSIRVLVLRLARENASWGYRRIHGELLTLRIKVAASTVWEILKEAGIDPAPDRGGQTWTAFLRSRRSHPRRGPLRDSDPEHRPHRGLSNARPLRLLPDPIVDQDAIARLTVRRHDRLGGIIHEYEQAAGPARTDFSAPTEHDCPQT
ncbi:hypothetical protein ACFQX7_29440 [Luedemannella flava]